MFDGLAFLPPEDVQIEMDFLRTIHPDGADALVQHFSGTYVEERYRRLPQQKITMEPQALLVFEGFRHASDLKYGMSTT